MGLLQKLAGKPTHQEVPAHWPSPGEAIWARLPCCEALVHPTQVEEVSGEGFSLMAPMKPHVRHVEPPEVGRTFVVGWRSGGASKQLRVEFVDTREHPILVWRVKPLAEAKVVQRRDFVRAAWDEPATFEFRMKTVEGKILDVSEGGLRCVLPKMDEPRDSLFRVSFLLDSGPVELEAEIAWWAQPMDETVQIGLTFTTQETAVRDRLRAQAYGLQLDQRRRGLPDI